MVYILLCLAYFAYYIRDSSLTMQMVDFFHAPYYHGIQLYICFIVAGHLGGFQFGCITDGAPVNDSVHIFWR